MRKRTKIAIAISVFVVALAGVVFGMNAVANTDDGIIVNGVYINSVDISGMNMAEATQAVDQYVEELKATKLKVKIDDNVVETTLDELGYDYLPNNYIEEALKVGKSGNLIKRYKELKDIERDKLVYELEFSLDKNKLQALVEIDCAQHNIPAVDATISRENGVFIITEEKTGRKVVTDETIKKIENGILNNRISGNLVVEAVVIDDMPKYTKAMLEKCDTVLGSFSTTYADSSASRASNLANGAKHIDGTFLMPGEVFSAYERLSPFTTANGYSTAGAYLNGKVVDSIGGGVCQVTTTLYNAILYAELEVVERYAHSMIVGYVEPARDAAIAGTYKDLKFRNNTDAPIYIESYTRGRTITFNIYGDETRDTENRKIKLISDVVQKIDPPEEVITEDPTQPTTYRKVTQSAHVGYKANLYKVVYENGVEVSREKINYSSYAPEPRYVTVGTKPVEEEEVEEIEEEIEENLEENPTDKPGKPDEEKEEQIEESENVSEEDETSPDVE